MHARPPYTIGIMKVKVEETKASKNFGELVDQGLALFRQELKDLNVSISVFQFTGPHLIPVEGAYLPFDFLQLGVSEKIERDIDFLLILTEVDLSPTTHTYVLAYPSQLTNIGIISTKRLWSEFWGRAPDQQLAARRLSALLLHTFGHTLGLPHDENPTNAMYDFTIIDDLDGMRVYDARQIHAIQQRLPAEAHDRVAQRHLVRFAFGQFFSNGGAILKGVWQVNPLHLLTRLPTMITTGVSVIILFLFNAEIWDIAGQVELYQIILFSLFAMIGAELLLYNSFGLTALSNRRKGLSESTVITIVTTQLSLIVTILLIYLIFLALMYLIVLFIIPPELMTTWPTAGPVTTPIDHLKLAMFSAGIGVLTGSLGGRSDSPKVIRSILFLNEES